MLRFLHELGLIGLSGPAWFLILWGLVFTLSMATANSLGKLSKKKPTKHMENSISKGGGGSAGGHFPYVITKDFKCTESHFEHF